MTNTCKCSRALLTAGVQQSARSTRTPTTGKLRKLVLIDRHSRVERVVEVLRANIQPLGQQAKLSRAQVARVRASGTRCEAVQERGRQPTVRASGIQVRSHRNDARDAVDWRPRGIHEGPHVNYLLVMLEQELAIRDELRRHIVRGGVRQIE